MEKGKGITLIVGTDGLIGNALMKRFRQAGRPVLGTTRRPESVNRSLVYLDLAEDMAGWRPPQPIDLAVICAGVTRLSDCESDPASTARINVHQVSRLAKALVEQGSFVVYPSSNLVFDGSTPHPSPEDQTSPVTEYGRQKAEVEVQLARWGESTAIVRLTKVLGPANPLFEGWVEALKAGEAIHPFSDMHMAPIPLPCAVSVLSLVGEMKLHGVLQVSGDQDVSYAEAARIGAALLKLDPSLVQSIPASASRSDGEPVPCHTALNTDRLQCALGIEPPNVWQTLEAAFLRPETLGA